MYTYTIENGTMYYRRVQDGHGGNAEEHRAEMQRIAEMVVNQKLEEIIPQIQRTTYIQAYNDIVNTLSFDVTSAVNIAFENGSSIFHDQKTQNIVANAVMNEVRKQLKKF